MGGEWTNIFHFKMQNLGMELIQMDFRNNEPDQLGMFDPSSQTIQDFLRLFKLRFGHVGSSDDQARRLYSDHLPPEVKARIGRSKDLTKLQDQLLAVYGTPFSLARMEMEKLNALIVPTDSEPTQFYAQHYAKLYEILESMESLRSINPASKEDFFSVIASQTNLDQFLHRLPPSDQAEFSRELVKEGKHLSSIPADLLYKRLTDYYYKLPTTA